jgi:SAM-dependent methyltransferase
MKTIVETPNLYDLLYANLSEDIDMYIKLLKDSKTILEFGAGTGRITIPLARKGHFIEAVDLSKDMLEKLKFRLSNDNQLSANIKIVLANMCNYRSSSLFDTIIIPLTSFNYLLTVKEQEECLISIKNNLKVNGFAIVELLSEKTFSDTNESENYKFIKKIEINKNEYYEYYRITKLDLFNRKIFQKRLFKYFVNNEFILEEELDWDNRFVTIEDFKGLSNKIGLEIETIYGNCQLEKYNDKSADVFIKLRRIL